MVSSKRIGFFWGEEKITLVVFEKNAPPKVSSSSLGSKASFSSPFSSNFAEEIQIGTVFQKMLQDNQMAGGPFHVSLPMKEIILRTFVIPFVKQEDIRNTIKFEAKKYLPLDIHDLAFIFYKTPFTENKIKRLQIVFFAVRKESLERYERIFKQANAVVSYCEPCMVSLTKVLLFKKEISPTDHVAFLVLDKNAGRICFINRGVPQFIREFSLSSNPSPEETKGPVDNLNLRIVNEVANSFDFYARQFSGDRVEQMLVSAETLEEGLSNDLETELRLKVRRVSPTVTMGETGQSNDIDTIYATGACLEAPVESLSGFNFLQDNAPKFKLKGTLIEILGSYKEIIFVFLICLISLVGAYIFFQLQLKVVQQQYDQLFSKQGHFLNVSVDDIRSTLKNDTDTLAAYKNIRTKSDTVFILLKVASHLPQGASLEKLSVTYDQGDSKDAHVTIEMDGDVLGEDPNEEIAVVNQIFSDFKNDKELSPFIKTVNLVSLNREELNGKQVTGFIIRCS